MSPSNWRQVILDHFSPEMAAVTRLTVVTDPDDLLLEQGVLDRLREAGFEIIPFDDPIAFRYHYESQYRERWDRGECTNLVVVLRTSQASEDALPFDLLEEARREKRVLQFNVAKVFEELVPSVVRALDRRFFDRLWNAVTNHAPKSLGEKQTKEFILRWVFSIVHEQIQTPVQMLHVLLSRHYGGETVPAAIDAYLLDRLRQSDRWRDWPLESILPDRAAFLAFMQERWPYFLQRKVRHGNVSNVATPDVGYGLRFPGVVDLPFDEIHFYMDNLFAEGLLSPVAAPTDMPDGWWRVGIQTESPEQIANERFLSLTRLLTETLPTTSADRTAWQAYALRLAEWLALRWTGKGDDQENQKLHTMIESRFSEWMTSHYAALASLPYLPRPTMVHHLASYLRATRKGAARCALIVVDGLAFDQWVVLRDCIQPRVLAAYTFDEQALFAWVPTLTSVSRQAIFAGQIPHYFASSISDTYREKDHWQRVWVDGGLSAPAISHVVHGKESWASFMANVQRAAERPNCRALGIVVNTVDRMMHGTDLGSAEMHVRVRHWAGTGEFQGLLNLLLGLGYELWLTADHGNIEGEGIGLPNAGVTAEVRGQRVFKFETTVQRDQFVAKYPGSYAWAGPGLPSDYHAMLAPSRGAFETEGVRIVAHGGVSVEEVIVPLVRVRSAS